MRKIATMLLTLAVSLSMALGGATAASAAPEVTRTIIIVGYETVIHSGLVYFSEPVASTTQLNLTLSACGRVLHTETFAGTTTLSRDDGGTEYAVGWRKVIDRSMAGPTINVDVTFSDPALPPVSGTIYTNTSYPRSCDALEPADDNDGGGSITVSKWSAKKGNTAAKVGKTLKVTPTRAAGSKVAYVWKVGTKTVDRDRAMTVKKAYKGKKVTMRVTVSKDGAKSVSKTLRYGTAR